MSIAGKKSVHLVKKDIKSQKTGAIAFKSLVFAHKATAGESGINLLALVAPSEMAAFTNPSITELSNSSLKFLRKNLKVVSSLRGELLDYLSYTVNTDTFIGFTDSFGTTLQDEIFVCTLSPVTQSGSLVADAEFILETGTLAASSTDIIVGKSFKTNLNPTKQLGAVMVIIDGQPFFRNVGNATASLSADGDYEEVDNGFGASTLIRLNAADSINSRSYMVVSTATTVIRPDGSIRDEVEAQQGTIDNIVSTVASLAGVPTSNFQAAPTQPQLAQFGNAVVSLSEPGSVGTPKLVTQNDRGAVKRAGQLLGTNTNDTADTGYVGELMLSADNAGTGISSGTTTNIASLVLTEGCWDVMGHGGIVRSSGGTLTVNWVYLSISLTSATNDSNFEAAHDFTVNGDKHTMVAPTRRITVPNGGTTTVYFTIFVQFSGTSANRFGTIRATRVR